MTDEKAQTSGKKLKIAVLIRNFVVTGGAERYTYQVSKRLARDHDVHIFCQRWDENLINGFTLHRVPKPLPGPSFLNQLVFSWFCRRMVDSSFDIIHSHERVTRFDVLTIHCPCYRGFLTRARVIRKLLLWLGEITSPRGLAYLGLEKSQFTFRPGRRLISDSKMARDDVIENYPLPEDYFTIAYPGVEFEAIDRAIAATDREKTRRELGLAAADFALLFVGTEFKRKGLDALLAGLRLVGDKRVKLVVVGGGDIDNYRAKARELEIEDQVIFTGMARDIYPLYIMADAFCLPTLADPCPIAPVEAMACGTATIMSNVPWCGTAEHVKNDEAIILGDPRDPEEIKKAIIRLLNDDEREKISSRGRDLARSITWEATTAATMTAFNEVLARRGEKR